MRRRDALIALGGVTVSPLLARLRLDLDVGSREHRIAQHSCAANGFSLHPLSPIALDKNYLSRSKKLCIRQRTY